MQNSNISKQQLTQEPNDQLALVNPMGNKESSNQSSIVNDIAVENTSSHVNPGDDKESSNESSSVNNIGVENTSSHVNPRDDKESSNVSSSVDIAAENTSSHVSPMDDKELPECVELNVHTKHNGLEIASKTPEQLKTQSFPQSDGASDKNEHIDNKHTVEKKKEDEHICSTQFAM